MKKFVKKVLAWAWFYIQLPFMYFAMIPLFTMLVHFTWIVIGLFRGFNEQIWKELTGAYDHIVQLALEVTEAGYNRAKNAG